MSVVPFTYIESLLCSVHFSKHSPYSFYVILVLWGNYLYPHFIYEETEAQSKGNTLDRLELKPEGTDDVGERSLEIKCPYFSSVINVLFKYSSFSCKLSWFSPFYNIINTITVDKRGCRYNSWVCTHLFFLSGAHVSIRDSYSQLQLL